MDFTPLRIRTIRPNTETGFDLYIHYKETYLLYKNADDSIPDNLHHKLMKQKLAKFYIDSKDEEKYHSYLDAILDEKLKDPNVSTSEKLDISEDSCATAMEQMEKNPTSLKAYNLTEKSASNLRQLMLANPDALLAVYDRSTDDKDRIIKHGINVCAMVTRFCEHIKFSEKESNFLATAALLHDFALAKSPESLLHKYLDHPQDLAPKEKLEIMSHPQRASELLKDRPYINENIINYILNHEENLSGTGPLKKAKLSEGQSILNLVDTFDKRLTFQKMTGKEAIKYVEINEVGNFDLKLLGTFKEFLKSEGFLKI